MKRETKSKQIIVKLDDLSYDKIKRQAEIEHRCLSEFIRHAVLCYFDNYEKGGYINDGF